jgi:CheY-like chemotaxis protein
MVQIQPSARFTVLLPSEQEGWHETLARLLEPQGVHTLLARSGREALGLIESRQFHAVVLDTHMPQLGGLQVIRLMREIRGRIPPPAILLTAHLTNYLLREALGMHVFSVLTKPVDFNVLLDALARVLRRYHEDRWPSEV